MHELQQDSEDLFIAVETTTTTTSYYHGIGCLNALTLREAFQPVQNVDSCERLRDLLGNGCVAITFVAGECTIYKSILVDAQCSCKRTSCKIHEQKAAGNKATFVEAFRKVICLWYLRQIPILTNGINVSGSSQLWLRGGIGNSWTCKCSAC